jgi:poly(3-hydroxybutyrate) depolymerase
MQLLARLTYLFLLSAALPDGTIAARSSGCGKALSSGLMGGGHSHNISISSGGRNRSFLLHLPPRYRSNVSAPVIFSFHGRGKNALEQELLSQFSNSSYNKEAIAIYPQGWPVLRLIPFGSKILTRGRVLKALFNGREILTHHHPTANMVSTTSSSHWT